MTRLLIARHGNTFDKGDVLLRVGKRTDLPLSISGKEQASNLGKFLANEGVVIDGVYSSNLQRTKETAKIALADMGSADVNVMPMSIFDEIDYGPDEGKPEDEVLSRIGKDAILKWDEKAIAPEGWIVDVDNIKSNWSEFADSIKDSDENILVVTSNGIARFAPYILDNPNEFIANNKIKLSTGAISSLLYINGSWQVEYWNKKPSF